MASSHTDRIVPITKNDPFDYSDEQLARRFALHYPDYRWVEAWRHWNRWNGSVWSKDKTLALYSHVRRFLTAFADSGHATDAQRMRLGSATTVTAVERLSRSDRKLAATDDQWDSYEWLLNTPTGIVDLQTGRIGPHDPEKYLTKFTAAGPEGKCPRWCKFLDEVTAGNTELQRFLQRAAGYALSGSTRERVLFFLYGTGRNGKSVFLNTLHGVLRDYAVVAPMEALTESRNDRHPTELAMLRGARLVIAQETEQGRGWAESRIKQLTGGDPITARLMRQDFFTFQPQFKLFVSGNHKPSLKTIDVAMQDRLHVIPFTVTIPNETRDPNLVDELRTEYAGILHWALHGCLEYLDRGLAPPAVVRDATNEYFVTQDVFQEWLDECCEVGEDYWAKSAGLFDSWKQFAGAANARVGNRSELHDKLATTGFRRRRNNSRGRFHVGLKLKPHHVARHHSDAS